MPKATVLDVVQELLSALESDNINSIVDTVESKQIAEIVRECFEDLVVEFNLGTQGQLVTLEDVGVVTQPTLLRMKDALSLIEWLNYGQSPELDGIRLLEDDAFRLLETGDYRLLEA